MGVVRWLMCDGWLCRDGTGSGGPRYEASSLHQLMMGMVEASASDGGAMRGLGSRGALDSIRQVCTVPPYPPIPSHWLISMQPF